MLMDYDYYINVKELMDKNLPKPKKKNYIVNYGEILPIITVECEV